MIEEKRLTFDVQSCRDLCAKLKRELERCERAKGGPEQSDHALNFAVTAWHLIDWIWWARESGKLEFKGKLAQESKNWDSGKEGLKEFRNYICGRCDLLRMCDVVATATKHWTADPRENRPFIEAVVSAGPTFKSSSAFEIENRSKLKIVKEDSRTDAIQIFRVIFHFWTKIINGETVER